SASTTRPTNSPVCASRRSTSRRTPSGIGYFPASQCRMVRVDTPRWPASHSLDTPSHSRTMRNSASVMRSSSGMPSGSPYCVGSELYCIESSKRGAPDPRPGAQWHVSGAGDGRVHRVSRDLPLADDLPAGRLQQLLGGGDGAGGGVVGVHVHAGVGVVDDPDAEPVDGGLGAVLVAVAEDLPLDDDHVAAAVGHDVRRGGDGGDVAVRVVELLGVLAVLGEAVGLVDLGGELGGAGFVQLAAGVVQQGGGVGEDLRVALDGGGLREDLNLAVAVDGEDGQVGEL